MRALVNEYNFNGYKFSIEYDTGGDPKYSVTVWIYKNEVELCYTDDNTSQVRRYFKNDNKTYLYNFCKKFATNEQYRKEYIENNKKY